MSDRFNCQVLFYHFHQWHPISKQYIIHMPNIICLLIDPPFFRQILHPMTPFFCCSPHPMTSFFQNFNVKFQIFHGVCRHIENLANFQLKMGNFQSNLTQCTLNDPLVWVVHTKKGPIVLDSTPNDPNFSTKSYTDALCFRSPGGTCPSLLYPVTPPAYEMLTSI